MKGYCVSCKKKVEIKGGRKVKLSNGRWQLQGHHHADKHKVYRFIVAPK